jgi:hypothetical protein
MRVRFGSKHFPNLQMVVERKHNTSKTRTAAAGGALAPNPKKSLDIYVLFSYLCTPNKNNMDTKLTLKLKKKVIDQAKKYANDHETSLSKLIENYLSAITTESAEKESISPLVKSISGVIELPNDFNHKENYHKLITEKYL